MGGTPYIGTTLASFIAWYTPLQVIAVVGRYYARRLTARPRGPDDVLVLASLLGQFVAAGIAIGKFPLLKVPTLQANEKRG